MTETTQAAAADQIRAGIHGMWASVAPAWEQHADHVDERGAVVTERILELAALQPGERVLELACGPGGLGLAAAERVAPDGEVVLSDVAPSMTKIAAGRAAGRGLQNVSTLQLDIERIEQPDSCYDAALCRDGLMFAVEPARAAAEIVRVLRPGGRFVAAVWGPREENPWLGSVLDAVSAQLGVPVPPPGIPGPFALADRDRLATLLSEAGLSHVAVDELPMSIRTGSLEEWWTRTSALAGPLSGMLAALPEEASRAIRARAEEAASAYATSDGLDFPALQLIASGRRS